MKYDLATLARRKRNVRRRSITFRDIVPPGVLATDLYQSSYRPVIEAWQRATPRIVAEYERTLVSMTTDSPADVQGEINGANELLQRLILLLRPNMRDWALRTESYVRQRWQGAVLSATGVSIDTLLGPEDAQETIEQVIEWNVNLVRDVSDQARQRISNAVFSGLNQRKPASEVAAEIREAASMSRRRSLNIASHQLSNLSSRLADQRRREAGITEWVWVHSKKRHPREEHVARNGKEYSDSNPPPTLPGAEPFCGCRSRAIIRFD